MHWSLVSFAFTPQTNHSRIRVEVNWASCIHFSPNFWVRLTQNTTQGNVTRGVKSSSLCHVVCKYKQSWILVEGNGYELPVDESVWFTLYIHYLYLKDFPVLASFWFLQMLKCEGINMLFLVLFPLSELISFLPLFLFHLNWSASITISKNNKCDCRSMNHSDKMPDYKRARVTMMWSLWILNAHSFIITFTCLCPPDSRRTDARCR